jgi:hypothetical protein
MPVARYLGGYLGGCLSSSSILALNTSPSFSSSVSPRLLPGPVELACCALGLVPPPEVAGCVGVPAAVLPPGLGSCVGVFAPPLLLGPVRAAVLARLLLLLAGGSRLALQLREVWPELLLASDFVLDLDPLPEEEELGLSSSSRDLVVVEGLIGLALSSRDLVVVEGLIGLALSSRHLYCLLSMGWFWNIFGRKKNACAGRGLATVTTSVTAANTTAARPVGRRRIRTSIMSVTDFTFYHSAWRCAIHVT